MAAVSLNVLEDAVINVLHILMLCLTLVSIDTLC